VSSPPDEASTPRRGSGSLAASDILLTLIYRSAWKGSSANFAFMEFSEVTSYLCT
jgi:hypothetical protein